MTFKLSGARGLKFHLLDPLLHALHQPLGGRGGAADADRLHPFEPCGLQFRFHLDEVGPRVRFLANVEENFSVRAYAPGDEDHDVVACGKLAELSVPAEDLAADRVLRMKFRGLLVEGVDHELLDALLKLSSLRRANAALSIVVCEKRTVFLLRSILSISSSDLITIASPLVWPTRPITSAWSALP